MMKIVMIMMLMCWERLMHAMIKIKMITKISEDADYDIDDANNDDDDDDDDDDEDEDDDDMKRRMLTIML